MTKHSPAPWNQGRDANGKPIICQEYDGRCNYGDDNPEYKANCRLIDAAPDLLEACETFAEWLGREESGFARAGNKRDTPEGERAWRDWYNENLRLCALAQEQARAAIAKATGEQP